MNRWIICAALRRLQPMKLRLFSLVLSGAVMVAVTGCGGGGGSGPSETGASQTGPRSLDKPLLHLSKAAYDKTMQRLGKQLGISVGGLYPLNTGLRGSDLADETVAKLQKTRGVVSGIMVALRRISPPAPIAPEHRRLEIGIQRLTDQLDTLILSLQKGDLRTFTYWSRLPSLRIISAATGAMKNKGYDVIGR
jgi:hypothetical protein